MSSPEILTATAMIALLATASLILVGKFLVGTFRGYSKRSMRARLREIDEMVISGH